MSAVREYRDDVLGQNLHTDLEIIWPTDAQRIVEHHFYPRQRILAPSFVRYLADAMLAGTYKPEPIQFAMLPDGRKFLIDGNHTLRAIIVSRRPIRLPIMTFLVADMEEVDRLYSRCDLGKTRTGADIWRALGVQLGLQRDSDIAKVKAAVELVRVDFGTRKGRVDYHVLGAVAEVLAPAAREYFAAIWGADNSFSKILRGAAVLGLGIVTIHDAQNPGWRESALAFWRGIALEDGLKRNSPQWHAYKHLTTTQIGSHYGGKTPVTTPQRARYLAACWNHWCDGRDVIRYIKPVETVEPIVVSRTRFAR